MELILIGAAGGLLGTVFVGSFIWWLLRSLKSKSRPSGAIKVVAPPEETVSRSNVENRKNGLDPSLEMAQLRGSVMRILERVQGVDESLKLLVEKERRQEALDEEELKESLGRVTAGLNSMAGQLGRQEVDLKTYMDERLKNLGLSFREGEASRESLRDSVSKIANRQRRLLEEIRGIAVSIAGNELPKEDMVRAASSLIDVGQYSDDVSHLLQSAGELIAAQRELKRDLRTQYWGLLLAIIGGPTSRDAARTDLIQMLGRFGSILAGLGAEGARSEWRDFTERLVRVAEGRFQQRLSFMVPTLGDSFDPASMISVDHQEGRIQEVIDLGLIDLLRDKEVIRKATVRLGGAEL